MPVRSARLAAVLLAALVALPACNKSRDKGPSSDGGGGGDGDGSPVFPFGSSDASAAQASKKKLRQIATAFHNFESTYGFMPAGVADKTGKPGLSWRVALLPYIEQDALYKQFKLDEPWDSEHNKKLIPRMPELYAPPGGGLPGQTYYQTFAGPGTPFPPQAPPARPGGILRGPQIAGFLDGTSNTLLVAEGAESVPWTKPADIPFAAGKPVKVGGGLFTHGFHGAMADGSTYFFSKTLNPKTLDLLIQIGDGTPIPPEAFDGR